MSIKKVASGWRGEIWLENQGGKNIATKKALADDKKGALIKEVEILRYLESKGIDFVPKVIDSDDGWFSYEWIQGEHFRDVWKNASREDKSPPTPLWEGGACEERILALLLLECAYSLDKVGVIHGELLRPTKNVLVSPIDNMSIAIIDFERGKMGDFSGKNMKHVAQWFASEGFFDIDFVRGLGDMELDEMYMHIRVNVEQIFAQKEEVRQGGSHTYTKKNKLESVVGWEQNTGMVRVMSMLHMIFLPTFFVALDQATKLFFYDLGWGEGIWWVTPAFNEGIAWSLGVGVSISIWASIVIMIGLIWYYVDYLKQLGDDRAEYMVFLLLEYGVLLTLGGAIGNLIDRVWLGGVRDFIDLGMEVASIQWPIFNIADICVSLGIGLILVYEFVQGGERR